MDQIQKIDENILNKMGNLGRGSENMLIWGIVALLLIIYAAFITPHINNSVAKFFNSPIIRAILFIIIVYVSRVSAAFGVLLTIAVLVSIMVSEKRRLSPEYMSGSIGRKTDCGCQILCACSKTKKRRRNGRRNGRVRGMSLPFPDEMGDYPDEGQCNGNGNGNGDNILYPDDDYEILPEPDENEEVFLPPYLDENGDMYDGENGENGRNGGNGGNGENGEYDLPIENIPVRPCPGSIEEENGEYQDDDINILPIEVPENPDEIVILPLPEPVDEIGILPIDDSNNEIGILPIPEDLDGDDQDFVIAPDEGENDGCLPFNIESRGQNKKNKIKRKIKMSQYKRRQPSKNKHLKTIKLKTSCEPDVGSFARRVKKHIAQRQKSLKSRGSQRKPHSYKKTNKSGKGHSKAKISFPVNTGYYKSTEFFSNDKKSLSSRTKREVKPYANGGLNGQFSNYALAN
jgi:hypothetical protein